MGVEEIAAATWQNMVSAWLVAAALHNTRRTHIGQTRLRGWRAMKKKAGGGQRGRAIFAVTGTQ